MSMNVLKMFLNKILHSHCFHLVRCDKKQNLIAKYITSKAGNASKDSKLRKSRMLNFEIRKLQASKRKRGHINVYTIYRCNVIFECRIYNFMKVQDYKKQVLPPFQNKLSQNELQAFKKVDLARLLPYLRDNSNLWSNKFFFQNISLQVLEELFAFIFTKPERKNKARDQLVFYIISMMKSNTAFIEYVCEQENFQKVKIFKFLTCEPICEEVLNAFGDIFTIYGRKIPGKVLKIIKNRQILHLIIEKMHLEPIHKFIFTMVFCLGQKPSTNERSVVQILIGKMFSILTDQLHPSSDSSKTFTNISQKVDYAESMSNMMNEIVVNVKNIYLGNIQVLFQLIKKHDFIDKLFQCLEQPVQSECSQFFIMILIKIIELNHEIEEMTQKMSSMEKIEEEFSSENLASLSYREVHKIILHLPDFTRKMLQYQQSHQKVTYSLGAKIKPIGFLRYRLLELFKTIYEFTPANKVNFAKINFNFIPIVKTCLNDNKWNNITQNMIAKVMRLFMEKSYTLFKKQNLEQKIGEGFLGFLIQNFRNRHFIYLQTMRFSFQGHRNTIYLVSKEIIYQMKERQDLKNVNKSFPEWEKFIYEDLKEYEKKCTSSKYLDEKEAQEKAKEKIQLLDPLQSIQEILNEQIEEQRRWSNSPKTNRKARRRKESLSTFEVANQIDSLKDLQVFVSEDQM